MDLCKRAYVIKFDKYTTFNSSFCLVDLCGQANPIYTKVVEVELILKFLHTTLIEVVKIVKLSN